MKARLEALLARVDALSLRERAIGFAMVLAVLGAGWHELAFDPLDRQRQALDGRVEQLRTQTEQLNAAARDLAGALDVDPDRDGRARVGALRDTLAGIDRELVALTALLVPPREMARVLETVLGRETDLRLLSLEAIAAEPLVTDTEPDPAAAAADATGAADAPVAVYRHGLRLQLEGGYLETLRYLETLERLGTRFLWESIDYRVEAHPRATVTITVYSLSLDEALLGV
ncbi:MAG: hypothetical protein H6983_12735 [Ectothiorhodospiraceae bacterium]|nr:hypothetical protein [Chromatiales bacterium]MCP5155029.1 hypothetical protein [Ectothiorhodospiraceae bacterium]